MICRFSLAILFSLFGHVCAFDEDINTPGNEAIHMVDFNEAQYVDDLMTYDENDLSYEEELNEDDGIKMNYEMPPLNRQYQGTFDQYYKEFEM